MSSIWNIDNNIKDDNEEFIKSQIIHFIGHNFRIMNHYTYVRSSLLRRYIEIVKKDNKYVVNIPFGSLYGYTDVLESFTNDLFEWGEINGSVCCQICNKLTSLKGAPKYVGGNFYIDHCGKLESLKGAPEYVGGEFDCSWCQHLKSLEGAPEEIGGDFKCIGCFELNSLQYSPKLIKGNFDCRECPKIISLDEIGEVKKNYL